MKTKILCIIISCLVTAASGQTGKVLYGISASADWNSYARVQDLGALDFKGRPNFSSGILMKYTLTERLSGDIGVQYATKNYKEIIDFSKYRAIEEGDPNLTEEREATLLHNQSYVDIPVGLNYHFARQDKLDFYAALGVVGATLVSYRAESTSTIFGENLNRSPYKDFLMSTKIGIGSLIRTGKLGINIEPQIRWYLQKVDRGNFVKNPIHFGLQLSVLKLYQQQK